MKRMWAAYTQLPFLREGKVQKRNQIDRGGRECLDSSIQKKVVNDFNLLSVSPKYTGPS